MKIAFHGGECCGIKHIHGLGACPEGQAGVKGERAFDDKEWVRDNEMNPDTNGLNVSSKINAYYEAAPKETYLERLDRYLDFLKEWRPGGIIEIVLCDYASCPSYNQLVWHDLLIERGFAVVNECLNSNSGNRIFVYHKVTAY